MSVKKARNPPRPQWRQGTCLWLLLMTTGLPVQDALAQQQALRLGPELHGAWHAPDAPGQGILLDSTADNRFLFAAWFTYQQATEARPGEQRWWTIQGEYVDGDSELGLYLTTGGEFDAATPAATQLAGSARLRFLSCNEAEIQYQFDDGASGIIPLSRLLPVQESNCDRLRAMQDLPASIDSDQTIAILNVNVLTMEDEDILRLNQTVVIENGVITLVAPAGEQNLPANAILLDGSGRYLMPGLVDTHTHLATNVIELLGLGADSQEIEQAGRNQLDLYLAKGVTSLFNLGDFGAPLPSWAAGIRSGQRRGPTLYTALYARGSPTSCDGGPVNRTVSDSEAAGRAYVVQAAVQGYDMMKIYNCTPPSAVQGILAEAAARGLPVTGHLPQGISGESLLLDPRYSLLAHPNAPLWTGFLSVQSPDAALEINAARAADGGTRMSTTLWIIEMIAQVWCRNAAGIEAYWADSNQQYMHPTERALHERSINSGRFAPPNCRQGAFQADLNFSRHIIRQWRDAGAGVLMGTDSPSVLGVAGFSAHDELRALLRAGLTPMEVLRAATRNGGDYIAAELDSQERFGRVSQGYRADLILLDSNPLDDVDGMEQAILGVVARGNFYSREATDGWLERVRGEYGN